MNEIFAFCLLFFAGCIGKAQRRTMTIKVNTAASALSLLLCTVLLTPAFSFQSPSLSRKRFSMAPSLKQASRRGADADLTTKPSLIVFDLDGCLWSPEMYELLWEGRGAGSPFTPIGENQMQSNSGTVVQLLGDVAHVLEELHSNPKWKDTHVGISSRTDEPTWAKELLQKFQLPESKVPLQTVFRGPIEISYDSKTSHFERISKSTGVPFEEILFFDNEFGNCKSVSRQGVSVCHCPDGVTRDAFNRAVNSFPCQWGQVVQG